MAHETSEDAASPVRPRLEPSTSLELDSLAAPPWQGVSPRLRWYLFVRMIAALVLIAIVGGVVVSVWLAPVFFAYGVLLVVAAVGTGSLYSMVAGRRWRWAEGRSDLFVAHGVLVRQVVVVPYGRIQVVDVTADPVERGLGLATVRIHTAAMTVDAYVCGLEESEADQLRERLAARSETFSTGL